MKKRNLLLVAVIIVCFALAISLKTLRDIKSPIVSEPSSEPALATQENVRTTDREVSLAQTRSAKRHASTITAPSAELKIHAVQHLAEVNGVAITTKDLLPIGANEAFAEFSISQERFDFLLSRAINRELAFQTAQARGVSLSQDQSRQLEQVRQSVQMRYGNDPDKVLPLNSTGSIEDQIAFELRDASASLLWESLLRSKGVASGHVTEAEVAQYIREHQAELGWSTGGPQSQSETLKNLDTKVRQRLASQTLLRYQEALDNYREQLKSKATIEMFPPTS